ncbi:ATP-binding protein, partial [Altererythrobacter litoralis]|nr:ATP-binding protein [Erythrobacteraceae bacterium 1XM1-14]
SNISHDLRTPLSVVIGSARMLENAPLEGADRTRLKRLQQASNVLYNLVNDVLDWSKIEAGEIDLEHEPVSLTDVFETLMTVMGEVAEEKGLTLTCDKAADLPHYVIGDAARIQQILFNLVSNAIKFTDEGEVRIRASKVAPHDPDNVRLRVEVSDSGVGISSEDQELLFQRFSQVDKSSTRRFQGTGLGLSIVKQLVELMGGSVGVESKPGVGSTFLVEVECARLDQVPIKQEAVGEQQEKLLAGKYVLLVDDSDLVAELAELMLETAGAKASTCGNGQEALDWLANNPGKADIVLMDVQMPIMDGITAVTIMRSDPVLKVIPVIAMTAGATKTKIDELLDAGMTDYITKPFTEKQLEDVLVAHIKP